MADPKKTKKTSATPKKVPATSEETASAPGNEDEAKDEGEPEQEDKSLTCTDQNACKDNVSDVEFFGGDLFKLLSKASSQKQGWMKSTKAMSVTGGCVVQVTTQQRNIDGTYSLAEAVCFVPGVSIRERRAEGSKEVTSRHLA